MLDFSYKQESKQVEIEEFSFGKSNQRLGPLCVSKDAFSYCSLPSFQQHLDLIIHLTRYSKALVAVVGETGLGKTTLMQQAALRAFDFSQVHLLNATFSFNTELLVRALLQGFNVSALQTSYEIDEILFQQLEQLQERANPSVLFIDEAENLSLEVLAALLALTESSTHQTVSLRIVLLGDVKLIKNLQNLRSEYPLNEIVHILQLSPLNYLESMSYLKFCFETDHPYETFYIDDEQANHIFEESHGVPARIKLLAQDYFVGNKMANQTVSFHWNNMLKKHIKKIIGALVLIFFLSLFLIFEGNRNNFSGFKTPAFLSHSNPSVLNSINANSINELPMVDRITATSSTLPSQGLIEESQLNTSNASVSNVMDAADTAVKNTNNSSPTSMISEPIESSVLKSRETLTSKNEKESKESADVLNFQEKNVKQTSDVKEPKKVEEQKVSPIPLKIPAVPMVAEESLNQTESAQPLVIKVPVDYAPVTKHYSVQLASLSTEERAREFIKTHELSSGYYIKTKSGQGDLFLVMFGSYTDKQAAQNAAKELENKNADFHPWVRERA